MYLKWIKISKNKFKNNNWVLESYELKIVPTNIKLPRYNMPNKNFTLEGFFLFFCLYFILHSMFVFWTCFNICTEIGRQDISVWQTYWRSLSGSLWVRQYCSHVKGRGELCCFVESQSSTFKYHLHWLPKLPGMYSPSTLEKKHSHLSLGRHLIFL